MSKILLTFVIISTSSLTFVCPLPKRNDESSTRELDLSRYHNYTAVHELFSRLEREYPDLARLYSIGKSVQQRELYVLRISSGINEVPKPTKLYPLFCEMQNFACIT